MNRPNRFLLSCAVTVFALGVVAPRLFSPAQAAPNAQGRRGSGSAKQPEAASATPANATHPHYLFAIAIDISSSFEEQFGPACQGAESILRTARPGDRIVLSVFSNDPQVLHDAVVSTESDLQAAIGIVRNLTISGLKGTDPYAALNLLLSKLAKTKDADFYQPKLCILMTDAFADKPGGGPRQLEQLNLDVLTQGYQVFLYFYNNHRDQDFIRVLSDRKVRFYVVSAAASPDALVELAKTIEDSRPVRPTTTSVPVTPSKPAVEQTTAETSPKTPPLAWVSFCRTHWRHIVLGLVLFAGLAFAAYVDVLRRRNQAAARHAERQMLRQLEAKTKRLGTDRILRLRVIDRTDLKPLVRPFRPQTLIRIGPDNADLPIQDPDGAHIEAEVRINESGQMVLGNGARSTFPFEIEGRTAPVPKGGSTGIRPGDVVQLSRRTRIRFEVAAERATGDRGGNATPQDLVARWARRPDGAAEPKAA